MSTAPIPFKLTAAGIDAAFAMGAVNLNVTHVQIGSGNATPSGGESALVSPQETGLISSHFEVSLQQHRISAVIAGSAAAYNISEIGLWSGSPGNPGSVLVFYWSQPAGHVAVKSASVDFNFETDIYFGGIVPSNITIVADTEFNSLAMIAAHQSDPYAHDAYATKIGVRDSIYSSAVAGGTVDAIIASLTPPVTDLINGAGVFIRSIGANATATPTFTPNDGTIAHKAIVKGNNLPLVAGDIAGAGYWMELRYDLTFDKWVLMNPAKGIAPVDLPIDVIYVPYTTPPTGYLKANGAAVSRATYANLFSKIGTTFGVGDGASTFNLPDLRGEFIRCWDDGRGIDSARGLGTYQRGTLEHRDLDGISGLSQHSGPSPAQPDTNRDSIGLDAPVLSDYPGDPFCNVSGPTGVNFTLSANTSHFGVMRPRNIALLACIKY